MVVLSIAIGTKTGKLLLCRDFSDISRTMVEDCVSSLPQLIKENQEHTFVEHNNMRLNYLPFGSMFLLSINDRSSNILEDIEVLRCVQSALHNVLAEGISEDSICRNSIDIIFTLDDLISLGHRNISSDSLLANALEMDSANERLILAQKSQQEAEAKKKAQEFIKQQRKKGLFSPTNSEVMSPVDSKESAGDVFSKGFEDRMKEIEVSNVKNTGIPESKKTLKLGTQKKKEKISEANEIKNSTGTKDGEKTGKSLLVEDSKPAFNPLGDAVIFNIAEQIECELDKEGKLLNFKVKGDLSFTILDPNLSKIAVQIESQKKASLGPKVPPSFNRKLWSDDSVLIPKDEKVSFQQNMVIPAIKYGFEKNSGSNLSPLIFSVWQTEDSLTIECEFNTNQSWLESLQNVVVRIPGITSKPNVSDESNSEFDYDSSTNEVLWTITRIGGNADHNSALSLEYTKPVAQDEIYPWSVTFEPAITVGDFQVGGVKNLENDEDVRFSTQTSAKLTSFLVKA